MSKERPRLKVAFSGKHYSTEDGGLLFLGQGGEGDVYELKGAKDDKGRPVVVKFFKLKGRDRKARYLRFREAAIKIAELVKTKKGMDNRGYFPFVEILGDPVLPPEHNDLSPDNMAYFFMPKLGKWNDARGHSAKYVVDSLLQILEGLEFFHGIGVAHRDIKASNILLDSDGKWKLSDYGLICFERSNGYRTHTGSKLQINGGPPELASSASYASFKDRFSVMRKSDIYLFGKLCWQLFTSKDFLFEGQFNLRSYAAWEFFDADKGHVPFMPMVKIMMRSILNEYGQRCELSFIREELELQKAYLGVNAPASLDENVREQYYSDMGKYASLRLQLDPNVSGIVAQGTQIEDALMKYGQDSCFDFVIGNAPELGNQLQSRLYRDIGNDLYYVERQGQRLYFRIVRLIAYAEPHDVLFQLELEECGAVDKGRILDSVPIRVGFFSSGAILKCISLVPPPRSFGGSC